MSKLLTDVKRLKAEGKSTKEISSILKCNPRTVRKYCNDESRLKGQARKVERARERKQILQNMLGGRCENCGYNDCSAALDFHHIDPSKKEFEIAKKYNFKKQLEELKKCMLLCCRCHREFHAGSISLDGAGYRNRTDAFNLEG